jgi:hypothetical protein
MRMQNVDKKFLLKTAKQLIARCSEYTPPKVKSSELNAGVAKAMLAVDDVLKLINQTKK